MPETLCPHCQRELTPKEGAAFCPYCGGSLALAARGDESEAVLALLSRVEALASPKEKHELLAKAMAEHPDSLAIAEELLFLGRLYQRDNRSLDFSVIKSYLLMPYLEPDTLTREQSEALRRELFTHPDLERCLRLSPDSAAYLAHYLTKLSGQFIDLFLRGSNTYMRRYFGIGLESRAPKLLAAPAARMLAAMQADEALTLEQRGMLKRAFFAAFSSQLSGDTQWLSKEMAERGVTLG